MNDEYEHGHDEETTHRATSTASYHECIATGLIKKRSQQYFKVLSENGLLTANEVFLKLGEEFTAFQHTRFTELRNQGVIEEFGTRKCSVTGRTVILWGVTGRLPTSPVKRESSKTIIKRLTTKIEELEARLAA